MGYTLGTGWILFEAWREKLSPETIFDMLLLQLIVGVCGSRFLYLIEYNDFWKNPMLFFEFERGGLTFYGAVISSIVFDFLFIKYKRLPFWQVMDCIGMGLPLGIMISRLGCFLNGCCHGGPCNYSWGVIFPKVSPVPLHPTQIYESLAGFAIFIFLQMFRKRRKNYGESFVVCMGLYGFLRGIIEFWRTDNPVFISGFTLSQCIGAGMVLSAIAAWKIIGKSSLLRIFPHVDQTRVS